MSDTKELQLMDVETGICYVFHLSEGEYTRAMNDNQYCMKLLHNAKTAPREPQLERNEEAIEDEALEANDEASCDAHDDGFRWVDSAVRLLLTEFKTKESLLHSGKASVKKFWDLISVKLEEKGYKITGPQCKSKLNGLKKTYKSVKDHNKKSGNNRRPWPYLEIMDDIFGQKPWVSPALTLDSASTIQPPQSPACSSKSISPSPSPPPPFPSSTSSCEGSRKRQKITHESAMEKLIKTMQENREDRKRLHEEAMSRRDKLLALLEKISDKSSE